MSNRSVPRPTIIQSGDLCLADVVGFLAHLGYPEPHIKLRQAMADGWIVASLIRASDGRSFHVRREFWLSSSADAAFSTLEITANLIVPKGSMMATPRATGWIVFEPSVSLDGWNRIDLRDRLTGLVIAPVDDATECFPPLAQWSEDEVSKARIIWGLMSKAASKPARDTAMSALTEIRRAKFDQAWKAWDVLRRGAVAAQGPEPIAHPKKALPPAELTRWIEQRIARLNAGEEPPSQDDLREEIEKAFPNHRLTQPQFRKAIKNTKLHTSQRGPRRKAEPRQ